MCTLRELLQDLPARNVRVAAGGRGLDHAVRGIRVCRLPGDESQARGGDLVLAALPRAPGSDAALSASIAALAAHPVTAVALRMANPTTQVVELAARTANRQDLPLLVLSGPSEWLNTLTSIHNRLLRSGGVPALHPVHGSLLDAARSAGIPGVVDRLAMLLERTATYAAADQQWASQWPTGRPGARLPPDRLWEQPCFRSVLNPDQVQRLAIGRSRGWGLPVVCGGQTTGMVAVWTSGGLTPTQCEALRFAAQLITTELTAARRMLGADEQWRNAYIADLLRGQIRSTWAGTATQAVLGVPEAGSFIVIQATAVGSAGVPPPEAALGRALNAAALEMKTILGMNAAPVHWPGCACMVLAWGADVAEEHLHTATLRATELLQRSLQRYLPGVRVNLGVSDAVSHVNQLPRARERAEQVLAMAQRDQRRDPVYEYGQMGVVSLLDSISDTAQVAAFADRMLQPLLACAPEKRAGMLEALELFFACDGDRRAVAQKLFVHPNTVSYRLHELERITGLSLAHSEDRFNLQLALRIRRFHGSCRSQG